MNKDIINKGQFSKWGIGEQYTLVRILGRGSYGEVAEAISHRNQNARVAVKQMERIFDEKTDAKRAYREMHILRHLSHPNIIGLLDVIFTEVRSADEGAALLQAEEMARAAAADAKNSDRYTSGDMKQAKDSNASTDDLSIWSAASSSDRRKGYHSPLDKIRLGNLYLIFEYMDTDLQKIFRSSQVCSHFFLYPADQVSMAW